MSKIKLLVVAIVIISVLTGLSRAQPKIPKENIPSNIPSEVKEQIEELYSKTPIKRGYGAYHLGNMGAKASPAKRFLIAILHDTSPLGWTVTGIASSHNTSPGKEAAMALYKIDKASVKTLIAAMKNKNSDVRENVAWALGETKDPHAVEPLIAALKDEDSDVRGRAALALGEMKAPRAVEPLIAALKDKDLRVREEAAKALEGITGQQFGQDPTGMAVGENNKAEGILRFEP